MTRLAVSGRDRRALGIGLLAVGCIGGLGRGLPALQRWDEGARATAAESMRELRSLEVGAGLLAVMADSLAARRQRVDVLSSMVLDGSTPAEAGAVLADVVADAADEAGALVGAVHVRPDSSYRAGLARVAVRLSATSDVTGLAELLQDLEGGELLLAVRELTVTQPEPAAPNGTPEALRFELLVEGLAMDPRLRKP
jgi:hypothetical protein